MILIFIKKQDRSFRFVQEDKRTSYCKPIEVERDGNCLYRAISCAISGHQIHHRALRMCAIFALFEYRAFFERLFVIFRISRHPTISSVLFVRTRETVID